MIINFFFRSTWTSEYNSLRSPINKWALNRYIHNIFISYTQKPIKIAHFFSEVIDYHHLLTIIAIEPLQVFTWSPGLWIKLVSFMRLPCTSWSIPPFYNRFDTRFFWLIRIVLFNSIVILYILIWIILHKLSTGLRSGKCIDKIRTITLLFSFPKGFIITFFFTIFYCLVLSTHTRLKVTTITHQLFQRTKAIQFRKLDVALEMGST